MFQKTREEEQRQTHLVMVGMKEEVVRRMVKRREEVDRMNQSLVNRIVNKTVNLVFLNMMNERRSIL